MCWRTGYSVLQHIHPAITPIIIHRLRPTPYLSIMFLPSCEDFFTCQDTMTPYLCCFRHFIYMRIVYALYDGNICDVCHMRNKLVQTFCTRERALIVNGSQFLHYDSVRWIPLHYRRFLPLRVMKRYRCIVVGSARGVLTVVFDEQPHPTVLAGLRRLTGQTIFPVLIRPKRMNLLLQRAEFCQRYRLSRYYHYYLPRSFIHSTISSIKSPFGKRSLR